MKVMLDQNAIQFMNMFQTMTGASVVDCVVDEDDIYFVVGEGKYGLAVGKGGVKIKEAEKRFKKVINVDEYSPTLENFIRNVMPGVQEIEVKDRKVVVKVKPSDRARAIGKSGKNIKIVNKFVQRLFEMEELKIK